MMKFVENSTPGEETPFCIAAFGSQKSAMDRQSLHRSALTPSATARLAQPAERKALNLVVVGSSPTVGVRCMGILAKLVVSSPTVGECCELRRHAARNCCFTAS